MMVLATCLYKMFSEKRCNVNGLKTLIKKYVSIGTIKRLPGNGCPQQTNFTSLALDNPVDWQQHLLDYGSQEAGLVRVEVGDKLYVVYFTAVSLWLSLLAKCKTFNVLYVGVGNYLSSTDVYMPSELPVCHQYQRIFIPQFNNFYTSKIWAFLSYIYLIFMHIWYFS